MTPDETTDLTVFIAQDGHQLVTDSRAVAIAFRKRHKNVLQTIERMHANQDPEISEHARLNFEPMSYRDTSGHEQRAFRMNCEGMVELSGHFARDKSQLVRICFLNAFEACPRRSKFDPPCRSNIDPGMGADRVTVSCG